MAKPTRDIWAQWLLHRRDAGDPARRQATLNHLYPIRDKVLANARMKDGDTLVDIGCGDGLIGFGALQQNPTCKVVFSDISQELLDRAAELAREMQVTDRCEFLRASADDLSIIPDASVDAVTTRSVLIYVADKVRAVGEFYRVLKPTGRMSVFEPINRFGTPEPEHVFGGMNATPVIDVVLKLKALYQGLDVDDARYARLADLLKIRNALAHANGQQRAMSAEAWRKLTEALNRRGSPPDEYRGFVILSPEYVRSAFEDVNASLRDLVNRARGGSPRRIEG